ELDRGAQAHCRKPGLLMEELGLGLEHDITDAQGIVLTLNEHAISPRHLIGKCSSVLVLPQGAFASWGEEALNPKDEMIQDATVGIDDRKGDSHVEIWIHAIAQRENRTEHFQVEVARKLLLISNSSTG